MEDMKLSHIKQVTKDEIQEVVQFTMEIIREVFPLMDPIVPPIDLRKLEEIYIIPEKAAFFAAYSKKGRMVGTIAARPYDGRIEQLRDSYDLPTTTEIVRCFVAPDFRRSGLGSKLVNKLVPFCKEAGYNTLYLHTHHFLPAALDFWKKQGFTTTWVDPDPTWQTVHMDRKM